MTTISQIITDAYQANNLVAISVIPSAAEQAKGLRYINRIFKSLLGNELGDQLKSWNVGSNGVTDNSSEDFENRLAAPFFTPVNARLVLNLSTASTVYLPTNPEAGARFAIQDKAGNLATYNLTLKANGRTIENSSQLVLNTNNYNSEWFFREDTGNWAKISSLALTDDFPLPEEFEEYFITMLTLRLDPAEGVALDQQLGVILQGMSRKFRARYRQSSNQRSELALTRTPGNPYGSYDLNLNSGVRFNYG